MYILHLALKTLVANRIRRILVAFADAYGYRKCPKSRLEPVEFGRQYDSHVALSHHLVSFLCLFSFLFLCFFYFFLLQQGPWGDDTV